MTEPRQPLNLQLVTFTELSVGVEDRTISGQPDRVALEFSRPDCEGAPLFGVYLTVDETVDLIDRLVQYAKDLYSEGEERDVETVRSGIHSALHALRARLHAIEGGYGKRWRDLRAA